MTTQSSYAVFRCGHPKSPENTRTRGDGRTLCRECDRAASLRWKERNRERNRARDRAFVAAPERRGVCRSPACDQLRGVDALRRAEEGYCEGCYGAIRDVRRTLAEGMWADGWTTYEIADAFGVTKDRLGIDVARWRQAGYVGAFPYRRTPEQVERITAGWQRVADGRRGA